MIKTIILKIDINVPKSIFKKITNKGLKNTLKDFLEYEVIDFPINEEEFICMEIKGVK